MSDIFSGIGGVASSAINADAMRSATNKQLDAITAQRNFVFSNLNPTTVQATTTNADIQNALARLNLQGQVDPALLAARYQSETNLLNQGSTLGNQSGQVADQATSEALAGTPGMQDAKNNLVDSALTQLKSGATLPPDVEAQLVQAGLEQSGMVTQGASGQGVGGQVLRTVLGTAGLNLQMQRQQQASQLLTSAQNLENSRQNILQQLFPRLSQTQLANIQGQQGILGTSAGMLPNAGLNGTQIANIMLARVGATNALTQSGAGIAAQGIMGQGQAWGNLAGSLGSTLGNAIPSIGSTLSGWLSGGGAQAGTDAINSGNAGTNAAVADSIASAALL